MKINIFVIAKVFFRHYFHNNWIWRCGMYNFHGPTCYSTLCFIWNPIDASLYLL